MKMVLKAKNTDAIPAFESDDNTAVADTPATESQAAASAEATTAIAKASAGAMAAHQPMKKAQAAFAEYEDALPEVDFGTFPRITADLGGFEMDKEVIGDTIKVEMMSWNNRYVVTPNVDNKEANGLVKYSNDGVTLSDGSGITVQEYLNTLKTVHGYTDASVKTYMDLTGLLVSKGSEEIPEDEQVVVQVQLSPQSVKQFNGYRITKGVFEARKGVQTGNVLTLKRERNEYNGKKFAYISFK
jgi:hypothetical protein